MDSRRTEIVRRLADRRGRRVVFLSHCLLNENVRYLGGATRPGGVEEIVAPLLRAGVGIYQMPCPEQRAWGGVLKRRMLLLYASKGSVLFRLRRLLVPLFMVYTRAVYGLLARRVARDVADYLASGFEVVGVVGVSASPSCGACKRLDLWRSIDAVSACPLAELTPEFVNGRVVADAAIPGEGMFVRALRRRLARRGLEVPFFEHDLIAEIEGRPVPPLPIDDLRDA